MSSGFGTKGKAGRCHGFWMDFSQCMAESTSLGACTKAKEDYFECLHHKKEFSRLNAIATEKKAVEAAAKKSS